METNQVEEIVSRVLLELEEEYEKVKVADCKVEEETPEGYSLLAEEYSSSSESEEEEDPTEPVEKRSEFQLSQDKSDLIKTLMSGMSIQSKPKWADDVSDKDLVDFIIHEKKKKF